MFYIFEHIYSQGHGGNCRTLNAIAIASTSRALLGQVSLLWRSYKDGPTAEKMNQLVGEYDALLRSQLMDQQLYFEKLLAKESVRALEMAYQLKNQQVL